MGTAIANPSLRAEGRPSSCDQTATTSVLNATAPAAAAPARHGPASARTRTRGKGSNPTSPSGLMSERADGNGPPRSASARQGWFSRHAHGFAYLTRRRSWLTIRPISGAALEAGSWLEARCYYCFPWRLSSSRPHHPRQASLLVSVSSHRVSSVPSRTVREGREQRVS